MCHFCSCMRIGQAHQVGRVRIINIYGITMLIGLACMYGAQAQQVPFRPYFHKALAALPDSCVQPAQVVDTLYLPRLWYGQPAAPLLRPAEMFAAPSHDYAFYFLMALLLVTGVARFVFPKYFADLHRVIFQTGFRQKSLREQLLQNKLASLVLNVLFFISAGTFLWLAACYKGHIVPGDSWWLLALSIGFMAGVYLIKNYALDLAKWLFGLGEALDTYKFIVFVLNKLLGMALLPCSLVLWVGASSMHPIVFTLALVLVGFTFLYRYILAFPVLRMVGNLSGGHFLMYLCAFELVPILIIAKILLSYLIR